MSPALPNESTINLTVYDINPEDVYNTNDIVSQIKAAFIYHLKKNTAKCSSILAQLFDTPEAFAVNEFDKIIVKIAQDLAEDIPASDPRWEERITANKHALGSSASMQIIQQLKEKNRAFGHFIDFLHATNLWEKVRAQSVRFRSKRQTIFKNGVFVHISVGCNRREKSSEIDVSHSGRFK